MRVGRSFLGRTGAGLAVRSDGEGCWPLSLVPRLDPPLTEIERPSSRQRVTNTFGRHRIETIKSALLMKAEWPSHCHSGLKMTRSLVAALISGN